MQLIQSTGKLAMAVAIGLASAVFAAPPKSMPVAAPSNTPALVRMNAANQAIEKASKRGEPYDDLAVALIARSRETCDSAILDQAEKAIATALKLNPKDFQAERARVQVLLARKQFAAAKELAQKLNQKMPDDVLVYGLVADACMNLGEYETAETAVQWMLDMRPGNAPGLLRAAMLRELFGDKDGALDFMRIVNQTCPPTETEEQSVRLARTAHLEVLSNRLPDAEVDARQAIEAFPTSVDALAALADVMIARGKDAEALNALRNRVAVSSRPDHLYDLGVILSRLGKIEEAASIFNRFEKAAIAQVDLPENANHQLVYYYTDYTKKPGDALRVAKAEMARRHDVQTQEAYAWALLTSGDARAAAEQMKLAMTVGYRDTQLLYHAGAISAATKNTAQAANEWKLAVESGPSLGVSPEAWKTMRRAVLQAATLEK